MFLLRNVPLLLNNSMLYKKGNTYYIYLTRKLVKLMVALDKEGNVDLKPTNEEIELNSNDINAYTQVTLEEIKNDLSKSNNKL